MFRFQLDGSSGVPPYLQLVQQGMQQLGGHAGAGQGLASTVADEPPVAIGLSDRRAGVNRFADAPAQWSSPREAKQHGVHVVYQEFALFPQLSVAENIFIGHERRNRLGMVDHARTRREAKELLALLEMLFTKLPDAYCKLPSIKAAVIMVLYTFICW